MSDFSNQKILVVGGAGFVGSNLVRMLLRDAPREIVIVDNLLSAETDNIPPAPQVTFIKGSITDDRILGSLRDDLDYVFHLSTYHGNQSSMHDPLADHENNTYTTLKLYETLKSFKKLKRVVYSSAGCTVAEKTYGEAHATEEDAPVSLYLDSPYQISKIIGEFYSNYYFMQHGLPVVKARFQNVYGPGEILGAGKWRGTPATVWRNVTPTFIYRALKGLPLRLENEGQSSRDFIYVEDIARGLMACALRGQAGGVYNLASGAETTILELAQAIVTAAGSTSALELVPRRNWDHSGRRFGSTEKARRDLGFSIQVGFQEGISRTVAWTRENLDLVDRCIQKHAQEMAACGAPL